MAIFFKRHERAQHEGCFQVQCVRNNDDRAHARQFDTGMRAEPLCLTR